MSKEDGGPAFPRSPYQEDGAVFRGKSGMSLRDWFAGQALIGIVALAENLNKRSDETLGDAMVRQAYALADAMLAERGK